MLARTHGQPASPTILGKEIMVFVERIEKQIEQFSYIPFTGKFGGATGNFNAHYVAYPKTDWISFANEFLENKLGIQRQQYTTQIEHYDLLAAHFDNIKRINTILIDLCRDMWTYISMDYFKQQIKKGEVGSSAMPHKVNPIDFENAEGNLGIANALLEHLSAKFLFQDCKEILLIHGYKKYWRACCTYDSCNKIVRKRIKKIILNQQKIDADLEDNWAVVSEAIQTILRRENYPKPYEALKNLTRGNSHITRQVIHKFIDKLLVSPAIKKELKKLTPKSYTGISNL